jgi:hypothetical protein
MKSTRPWLLGFLVWAAPQAVQAQLNYTINGGGVTITGYYGFGPAGILNIPATLDNMPVTGIGDGAFADLDSVTNVTIPASVTNIGIGAFSGCAYLTVITVAVQNPSYSSTNGVLFDKTLATLVEYPGGLTGTYVIPASVTAIGTSAFAQCGSLTNVVIPAGAASIGDDAFSDCTSMTNVAIPGSVTNIGASAFFGCSRLTGIAVDSQNSFYSSTNGVLFDKSQTTLIEYPGGLAGSYTVPDSVADIANFAFENCGRLSSVTISAGVSNIGTAAFFGCSNLTAIAVEPQNSTYSSTNGVLFDKNQTTLIEYPAGLTGNYTIPGGVTGIGEYAFENCQDLTGVSIPATVREIGGGAFDNCSRLTAVTIPASVTNMGAQAFDYCLSLTSITIPGGVLNVAASAFGNCSDLEKLTITDGVVNIESNAFENCYSLSSVTIPPSVTNIGGGAFEYCLSLTDVTIPDGVTSIGDEAFAFCSGLSTIALPDSVTNIGEEAFGYCSSLAGFAIPAGVANISSFTFYECAGLTKVIIPGSVSTIGTGAFEQCYGLSDVTISDGVASIGDYAFSDCTSLPTVAIPASVTNIGDGPYSDCASLTEITVDAQNSFFSSTNGVLFDKSGIMLVEYPGGLAGSYIIPASVTRVANDAFLNCSSLTQVTIPRSVTTVGADAFENCTGLAVLTIPAAVTNIGDGAFGGTGITNFYFTGDAPVVASSAFDFNNNPMVYYLPGTEGWAEFSSNAGVPTSIWNPVIQTGAGFGVRNNQFEFTITGPANLIVAVKVCTNFAEPAWTPISTVTLTNGLFYFSEPTQTNLSARFYGLGFP